MAEKYYANGGKFKGGSSVIEIEDGSVIEDPARAGFRFAGWDDNRRAVWKYCMWVRIAGRWKPVRTIFMKKDGKWREMNSTDWKINGKWRTACTPAPLKIYEMNRRNISGIGKQPLTRLSGETGIIL